MHDTKTLRRHATLVDRMAQARGLDLEETMLRGKLSIPELDDAVLRCTGCTQPCACETWLDQQTAPVTATPGYCRNADLFADLARDRS